MEKQTEAQALFPLSLNQMNIRALEQSMPGTSVNNISTTVRIQGRVDLVLLRDAVWLVLQADASLRTRITLRDGVPMQYHAPFEPIPLQLLDFSGADEESFAHWVAAASQTPLFATDAPLFRFILCRTGENAAVLFVQTHHIISDGWTQIMLCNRIGEAYLALLEGHAPALTDSPDYADYVAEEQEYLSSPAYEKDKAYWEEALRTAGDAAALRGVSGSTMSHVGRRTRFQLSGQLNHAICSFCREQRVSPFAVFYMALAAYLHRSGSGNRFTIGTPVFNRTTHAFKQTSGMFVSTLPFFGEVEGEWSFRRFSEEFTMQWMDLLRHQRFPFAELSRMSGGGEPLFRMMLSYQDSQVLESPLASVRISGDWYYSGYQSEQLCIHLTNLEDDRVFAVDYDYLVQIFSAQDIAELHGYLCHILSAGLAAPDTPIRELSLLDPEERERVVYGFNQTYAPRFDRTPYELLAEAARKHPRRTAVIHGGIRTSYEDLLRRGEAVAAALPLPRQLAAVLLPRDERLFCAMVGIMQANCAWLLLSPEQPQRRIEEILKQSGADILISTPVLSAPFKDCGASILDIDALPAVGADAVRGTPEDLAYVVYTSGSTGTPKGVEINQKSLVNLAMAMAPVYRDCALLSLCNVGFDAFVLESAAALLCGCTVFLTDDQQKERPDALAELITDYGLDMLSTTPSRLSALLDSPRFAAAAGRLKTILCGGEKFPGDLLQRLKAGTEARIYNQYGPSEATVAVSMVCLNDATHITIGRPMENCRLYVLDDSLRPLPVNVCGELYIGGVCVGRGYRNAPELTEAAFLPSPFVCGETLYKTGDSAYWNQNGELVLAGRRDDQVKIRGLRVELQEISACFCRHPEITAAAARVTEHCGQQIIVAYYTAQREIPELDLLRFAAGFLPNYMVPTRVLRVDAIPLTRNGKADLSKLPEPPEEAASLPAAGETEAEILRIFREVLQNNALYADSNYFLCGGNSLNAMDTVSRLEERFGVRLMVSDLYVCRNARNLAAFLSEGGAAAAEPAIVPAPRRDSYPLTGTQKSIYLQSCLDESGFAYHMPCAFRFGEAPDRARLEEAFCRLIEDDPLFRTRFLLKDGDVAAVVEDRVSFSLPLLTAADWESAFSAFLRPFDLAAAPLLRAALWQDEGGAWYLLVDMHHIIGDGQSTPMMLRRLDAFYRGEQPTAHLTYHDFSVYHAEHPAAGDAHLDYWKQALSGCSDVLDLPQDKPRPRRFSFRGDLRTATLSGEACAAADRFCTDHELTPYMFFSGVLGILFARISGADDLLIGSPVSGRVRPELREVCGPLMGTLPLRLRPVGSIASYFSAVKDTTLAMLDHTGASIESIVSAMDIPHSEDRNPLYQALFQVRPLDADAFSLGGIGLAYLPIPTGSAKLDLNMEAYRSGDRWQLSFEYASDIFEPETIAYYGRCVDTLIRSLAAADADEDVRALNALSPVDRLRCIERPRRRSGSYSDSTVAQYIAEETILHPEKTAIYWHDRQLSFAALEERACEIAGILRSAGAVAGDRIGLVCRRTPDLPAALLAILRCGCAYVPFLYDFPAARVAYMMETADVRLILCDADGRTLLPEAARVRPVAYLDSAAVPVTEPATAELGDTMYVLFTSGSTGKPKGVQIPHRAVSNLLDNLRELMHGETGPYLCATNMTFDIFCTESLLALAQGFGVVLADEDEMMLPWKLAELILRRNPTMMQFTPSRLQLCLNNSDFAAAVSSVRFAIVAGEAMPASLVRRFRACCPGRLINMYGPTEAAVYVTAGELQPDETVTIGAPLKNCRIYIPDEDLLPVMPTARGELYIAGPCLADGYISRPDLTEERFLDDPFFPGEKMYRSGDLGRVRMDGSIEYLGRADAQVKINGNRVELGEITEVLLSAGAQQATVFAGKGPDGSDLLIAAAAPESLSVDTLRRALSAALPGYMIPAQFFLLPQLPQNASGKIDLPAVLSITRSAASANDPAPVPAQAVPEAVQPETDVPEQTPEEALPPELPLTESEKAADEAVDAAPDALPIPAPAEAPDADALLEVWKQVLKRSDLDPEISFFEQGGTSLSALNILSEYYNHHIQMTLAEFYRAPTVQAQAELLRSRSGSASVPAAPISETPAVATEPVETASTDSVPEDRQDTAAEMEPDTAADIEPDTDAQQELLLTGATGFLGVHLLRRFLEQGTQRILCLMRDGDPERLRQTLAWYFGAGWAAEHIGRLDVLRGDIRSVHFGLSPEEYARLTRRVGTVCHAAADVRHYAADSDLTETNLTGTANTLRFAADADAEMLYISTASVSGSFVESDPEQLHVFGECDLDIGQNWKDNLYIRSKFLAEQEVQKFAAAGLHARVFRIGRLVGRSSDGVFQRNPDSNAFYRVIQGVKVLRAIPESLASAPVELSPVDVCADAIAALRNAQRGVYHVVQPCPLPLGQVLQSVIPGLEVLPDAEFAARLGAAAAANAAMLASLIDTWNGQTGGPGNVVLSSERTQLLLRRAGILWPSELGHALDTF